MYYHITREAREKIKTQLRVEWPSFFTTCKKTGDWSRVTSAHPLVWGDASNVEGQVSQLIGDVSRISGNISHIFGHLQCESHPGVVVCTRSVSRTGGMYTEKYNGIWGDVSNISGEVSGLIGNVSNLRGDVSFLFGEISSELKGDVSEIRGDITCLSGDVTGIRGRVLDILPILLQD